MFLFSALSSNANTNFDVINGITFALPSTKSILAEIHLETNLIVIVDRLHVASLITNQLEIQMRHKKNLATSKPFLRTCILEDKTKLM